MCDRVFRIHWKIFLGVSIFTGIFAAVYEHFGHGIISKPMVYAFVYPLALGFLPILLVSLQKRTKNVRYGSWLRVGINMYYSGIATLTLGSVATGVVEIYGTTNRLLKYYSIVGWPLLGVGMLMSVIFLGLGNRETSDADAEAEA